MDLRHERVAAARERVAMGFYRSSGELRPAESLRRALTGASDAARLIVDLTAATSAARSPEGGIVPLARSLVSEGARGFSVDPALREGTLGLSWLRALAPVRAPTLMRDTFVAEEQIDCAASLGASAITLSAGLLPRTRLPKLVEYGRLADREVLVECADVAEVEAAARSEADLIGILGVDVAPLNEAARASGTPSLWLDPPREPPTSWPPCDAALVPPLVRKGAWTLAPWLAVSRGVQ